MEKLFHGGQMLVASAVGEGEVAIFVFCLHLSPLPQLAA